MSLAELGPELPRLGRLCCSWSRLLVLGAVCQSVGGLIRFTTPQLIFPQLDHTRLQGIWKGIDLFLSLAELRP